MTKAEAARVSIVMPAFAAGATIAAAVASVLAQSHRDWELLIVADDGADYADLLREAGIADARIRFLATSQPASGPAAARNLGQRHATGAFVTRLDADDLYEPARLERLLPLARAHGVAGDNALAFDAAGSLGTVLSPTVATLWLGAYEVMLSPVPWSLLFRRALLPEWDEDLRFAEDVLFNARAFAHLERLPVAGEPLLRYRVAASSLSHAAGASDLAEATYARLIAECEEGAPRGLPPRLAAEWRRALEAKRALNRAYLAAGAEGGRLSFQEFAMRRRASAAP